MTEPPDSPPQLPTRPPTPDEAGWQNWRRSDEQETPRRLEETRQNHRRR